MLTPHRLLVGLMAATGARAVQNGTVQNGTVQTALRTYGGGSCGMCAGTSHRGVATLAADCQQLCDADRENCDSVGGPARGAARSGRYASGAGHTIATPETMVWSSQAAPAI